jgi:beta-galactosidase
MSLTTASSRQGVRETADSAVAALERRGIQVFARVDHAGEARAAGLELGDEELLVFGDPRVGTLLMQSDPQVGYELPLRLLVWDDAGQTSIGYRRPSELADDYAVADQAAVLERMDGLMEQLVAEIVAPE